MSKQKENSKTKSSKKNPTATYPVVPLQSFVPLPGLVIPIYAKKKSTVKAIDSALETGGRVVLSLQSGAGDSRPSKKNLLRIAASAEIIKAVKLPSGDVQADFHVQERVRILEFQSMSPYIVAKVELVPASKVVKLSAAEQKLVEEVKLRANLLSEYDSALEEHKETLFELFDPGELADLVGSVLQINATDVQVLLEEFDPIVRLTHSLKLINSQIDSRLIKDRFSKKAESEVTRSQHQELLREQLRLIRSELGEGVDHDDEISGLGAQLTKLKMPPGVREEAEKQLRRLQQLHPDTSEAALARTYIDWIIDLPWSQRSKDRLDLKLAKGILDQDHYGLEKTKERVLDFLGVRKLTSGSKGPILLLVGPPGVGKTSLGKSIAKALNREFIRLSVGGLRDEAELRGHRRTYVGALPGRIIQGLKTAGTKNPVFILDEVDKIGSDYRGDPSSVLLEILDPEQNGTFEDHYLNIPFDLSEVMFVCTANVVDAIPEPLLDRMEVIEINGYTAEEKLEIAKRYLLPQEIERNGLAGRELKIAEKSLLHIMNGYTKESGVRELRRSIGAVCRKIARMVAEDSEPPTAISPKLVQKLLGPVRYVPDRRLQSDEIGLVTGLAWTSTGGEVLTIEAALTAGSGELSLTGQLGEVMKESAMTALTCILSKMSELGIDPDLYKKSKIHVHVPQGAIPKDGPSAGITIATVLASVLTGRPVSHKVAMTGEITLRGNVLQVGGVKEKALAALRNGMSQILIPKENERELVEFPAYLKEQLEFITVQDIDQVLQVALKLGDDQPHNDSLVEKRLKVKRPIIRR